MKAWALGTLLRAREGRERLAAGRMGALAEELRRAEAAWLDAQREAEAFQASLRAREEEGFRTLSAGATSADWAEERLALARLREGLARLRDREKEALGRKETAAAALAQARLAYRFRMRERVKLEKNHENWLMGETRRAEDAEEREMEP